MPWSYIQFKVYKTLDNGSYGISVVVYNIVLLFSFFLVIIRAL
jgi:hypothetical protein